MRTSTEFQTSSLVLLLATVVFGAFAAVCIYPMLSRKGVSGFPVVSAKDGQISPKYAEFFPAEKEDVQNRLDSVTAMSGRPVDLTRSNFGSDSASQQQSKSLWSQSRSSDNYASSIPRRQPGVAGGIRDERLQTGQSPFGSVVSFGTANHEEERTDHDVPERLPAGSVYAPITVNLDGSVLTGQMQAMEARLESMLDSRIPEGGDEGRKVARAGRRKTGAKNGLRNAVPDESLVGINDGLQKLAGSLKELERKTELSLNQIARQTALREVTSRYHMEEWQRLVDQRLRAAETAARTVVASRPSSTVIDSAETGFSTPEFNEQPVPQSSSDLIYEQKTSPEVMTEDTQEASEIPQQGEEPVPFPVQPQSISETVPATTFEPQSKSFDEPIVSEPREVVVSEPVLLRGEDFQSGLTKDVSLPAPTIEVLENPEELPAVEMIESDTREFVPHIEDSPQTTPVEKPAELTLPQATLKPVPAMPAADLPVLEKPALNLPVADSLSTDVVQPRSLPGPDVTPVGFEHVYRFKMAEVEGANAVVPADGACPHCGKVHHGYCLHQTSPQVVQTSASTDSQNDASESTAQARKPSTPKRYIPRLKVPSLTTSDDEPGLLHRIGSSLRHIGRKTVK